MAWKNKKLYVENWCQHRELTVEFDDFSNGIVGPNGNGKSNLIKAMLFLMSRECDDNLQDNIRSGTTYSNIRLDAEINGVAVVLKAGIKTDAEHTKVTSQSHVLTVGSEKPVKGISAVKAKLEEIVGIPLPMLSKYIFIGQNDLAALLSSRASERLDGFIKMLPGGVHASDARRANVRAEMNAHPEKINPFDDTELGARAIELDGAMATADALTTHLKAQVDAVDAQGLRKALAEHTAATSYAMAIPQHQARVTTMSGNVDVINAELIGLRAELVAAEAVSVTDAGVDVQRLTTDATLFRAYDPQTLANVSNEMGAVSGSLTALTPPPGTTTDVEMAAYEAEVTAMVVAEHAKLAVLSGKQQISQKIRDTGNAQCPTCGSVVDDAADVDAEVAVVQASIAAKSQELQVVKSARSDLQVYINTKAQLESKLITLNTSLQNIHVPDIDAATCTAYEAEIARVTASRQNLNQLLGVVPAKEAGVKQAEAAVDLAKQSLATAIAASAGVLDSVTVDQHNQVLTAHDLAVTQLTTATAELSSLVAQAAAVADNIAASKSIELERGANVEYRALLQDVYDGLHREAFPKAVLQYYLEEFRTQVSLILAKFDSPFTVDITDDLEFFCTMPTGYRCPANRLSGGQEAVFSVALRMAVANLFCGGVGFLIIDEPAAAMDDENVKLLAGLVRKLHDISTNSDLQIILITHHVLDGCFNKLINLGEV